MEEAKSEMSILDEDAKFIDTPCLPKSPSFTPLLDLKHHYGFSSSFLLRFLCSPSSAPSLRTKGGCPGSEGVAVLKCEGL